VCDTLIPEIEHGIYVLLILATLVEEILLVEEIAARHNFQGCCNAKNTHTISGGA
jgi:hypothetical protein